MWIIILMVQSAQFQQAQSELIALAADLPEDPDVLLQVGGMFLQAGDPARALEEFRQVSRLEPRNAAALAGAGQAAFQQANYPLARRYLQRAVTLNPADTRSAQLLQTSDLVLQLDPYLPRIGNAERARRVLQALEHAGNRLEDCARKLNIDLTRQPPTNPIAVDNADLEALNERASRRVLARDADLVDAAMDMVFRSEADATVACGQPQGADLALSLIARVNGGRQ